MNDTFALSLRYLEPVLWIEYLQWDFLKRIILSGPFETVLATLRRNIALESIETFQSYFLLYAIEL
jgi:hypothetical protein